MQKLIGTTLLAASACLLHTNRAQANEDPIQVFILAGQSNMVGYGKTENGIAPDYDGTGPREVAGGIGGLRYMVQQDLATFGHGGTNPLVGPDQSAPGDGDWIIRDDVNVYAHNGGDTDPIIKISGHTAGLGGWSSSNRTNFGPEYGFGQVVGNAIGEDVLIIKIADGGTSLSSNWRSPTAVANRGGSVGRMWNTLTTEVNQVLTNLDTHFPEYAGRTTEFVGFGWHQGWNDQNSTASQEYEANMADFIRDVQGTYGEDLPFIIATTGQGGDGITSEDQLRIIDAQLAMGDAELYPEFDGEVAVVDTRSMWRPAEESANNQGFHWNGNGITMYEIGAGMGEAYLQTVPEPGSLAILGACALLVMRRRRSD